jgi:DNA-binding IclR family transcriptional regulator
MTIVSTAQIVALLHTRPEGMLAAEVCDHFGLHMANLSSRLSKLAAYGLIRMRTTSRSVLPNGKTTASSVRHFLPPADGPR